MKLQTAWATCLIVIFSRHSGVSGNCDAATQFKCTSDFNLDGQKKSPDEVCIPKAYQHDGVPDCWDLSDERNSSLSPCALDRISCIADSTCIASNQRMDYSGDCGDKSDEIKRLDIMCNATISKFPCNESVPNSICVSNRCACATGYIRSNRTFCRERILDDSCNAPVDCTTFIENSTCLSLHCTCDVPFTPNTTQACRLRVIGDECMTNANCNEAVSNSICDSNICACDIPYRYDVDIPKCILRGHGDTCDPNETESCSALGSGGRCDASGMKCTCAVTWLYFPKISKCTNLDNKPPCSTNEDCKPITGAICKDGLCKCENGDKDTITCKEATDTVIIAVVVSLVLLLIIIIIIVLLWYFCVKNKSTNHRWVEYRRENTNRLTRRHSTKVLPGPPPMTNNATSGDINADDVTSQFSGVSENGAEGILAAPVAPQVAIPAGNSSTRYKDKELPQALRMDPMHLPMTSHPGRHLAPLNDRHQYKAGESLQDIAL